MTPSSFVELNKLSKQDDLWVLGQPTDFNHPDQEASELFLKRIVSEARDLSSQSIELETCYPDWDWVAEYHLSYRRANLLRGFDLSKIETALEIGCGCGAITRYLGEQGICVDAIEGAKRRADIAQLRCRDMDNVRIINANYNDLQLPESTYDAIFIVGVIEYAGKFLSGADSDETAVVTILKQLQNALSENGVLIIAIENRNGLKYWLGATEDHFGKPYVGLTNYWGLSGTKTYTYKEWSDLIQKADIAHWHFQFPFPDYKLPQLILDEDFIDSDENAYSLLYRIRSRDYLRPWQSGVNEFAMWRALHQSGKLKEYANSFLIVAGQNPDGITSLIPSDFVYLSGGSRKPEFRTATLKDRQSDQIIKKHLWLKEGEVQKELTQQVSDSPYIKGTLLSAIWLEALLAPDCSQFEQLLNRYCKFMKRQLTNGIESSLIDALPANIVVNSEDTYRIIDQEWQTPNSITTEFLLFRSLLWFGHDNQDLLADFFRSNKLNCLSEFIEFGFNLASVFPSSSIVEFAEKEDAIQFQVSGQMNLHPIKLLLTAPFNLSQVQNSCMKLYWAGEENTFADPQGSEINYNFANGRAFIQCRFAFDRQVSCVRIRPLYHASEAKLLVFEKMTLSKLEEDTASKNTIWQASLNNQIADDVHHNHFILPLSNLKGSFVANNRKAFLDFQINCPPDDDVTGGGLFELELVVANEAGLWPSQITEQMADQSDTIEQKFNRLQKINTELETEVKKADRLVAENNSAVMVGENLIRQLTAQLHDANERVQLNQKKQSAVISELKAMRQFVSQLSQVKIVKNAGRVMPRKYGWITSGLNQYNRFNLNPADYDLIKDSGLFNETFYLEYQPDLTEFNSDPLRHYLLFGGFHGLNPNRLFDTPFYLKQCPGLVDEKTNPLVHYLSAGADEGKDPCYLFDTDYYLDQHPEISEYGENPLIHYLKKGGGEGLDPHPVFDSTYYFLQRPDAPNSPLTPLEHFFTYGEPDQISPTALFDSDYYLEKRPSLQGVDISAVRHFIEYGFREGRDFSRVFDSQHYFYPDMKDQEYKVNPVTHYIQKGQFENRSPNPFFDLNYYEKQTNLKEQRCFKDPFSHYISKGEQEGADPHPLINNLFYKKQMEKIDNHPRGLLRYFYKNGFVNSCMTHPLLEPGFYQAQLPCNEQKGDAQLLRYFKEDDFGAAQNPHPLFDADYYRSLLDAEDSGRINPLIHYVKKGCQQGLSTHPEFDPEYYCSHGLDPELNDSQSPVAHYIYHGAQKGWWPSQEIAQLAFKPQLSLVLLVNGPDFTHLSGRIVALMAQLYSNWRATVMVRNPDHSDNYRYAKALAEDDERILWTETDDSDSAATLLNQALEKSTGDYVVFLNERYFLQAHALLTFVRRLNVNQNFTLIHTDRNENDPECIPIEQPGFEANGLSARFFIGPLACFRRAIIDQMGGFATWHQSPYDAKFLTHYLHQVPINSVAHISEPLHYTMAKDLLNIVVRSK